MMFLSVGVSRGVYRMNTEIERKPWLSKHCERDTRLIPMGVGFRISSWHEEFERRDASRGGQGMPGHTISPSVVISWSQNGGFLL